MVPNLEVLSAEQERELLWGRPIIPGHGLGDVELLREAWRLHRARLLPAWIKEHPGTRPFAEWLCRIVPKYGERPSTDFGSRWPSPVRHREGNMLNLIRHTHTVPRAQEPEVEFLARHNLLSPAEKRLYAAGELSDDCWLFAGAEHERPALV
jgi:hypothetical protein